jgi:hypothetical protein
MRNFLLAVLLFLYLPCAVATEIPAVIRECLEQNLPKSTSVQAIELRARDRSGYEQVLQSNVYLKRYEDGHSRILMHFDEPADVRGARFLIIQKEPQSDMYIYMPGLFVVRKITTRRISSSVLGTDFSYEDFERLYGILKDLKAEQYPDDVLSGRPVHVLNSYPASSSDYVKITTFIDTETCVVLKTELFEKGHELRKVLTVDPATIRSAGSMQVPGEMLMRDLRDETETHLVIKNIKTGLSLPDSLFDHRQLKTTDIPPIPVD